MKITYIELLGKKYPLCFSLAASEKIAEQYGSLEAMQETLTSGDLVRTARCAEFVLGAMLKAGRIYCAAAEMELPPELPCRVADLIDVRDGEAISAIFSTVSAGAEREVETEGKNRTATQESPAMRGSTTTAQGPG